MSLLGTAYIVSGRSKSANELLGPFVEERPDPTANRGLARAYMAYARSLLLTGNASQAAEYGGKALRAGDLLGLEEVAAQAMITRGTALSDMARHREAMALLRAAFAIANEHGLVGTKLRSLANIGYSSQDPQESLEATERGYVESRRVGDKSHLQFFAGNWASSLLWSRDPAPIRDMDQDPVFADAPPGWWSMYRVYRSAAEFQRGDLEEATRQYEMAVELAEGTDDLQLSLALRRGKVELLWAEGKNREAFDEAMAISRSTEMGPGLNVWWARTVALFANDASMRAELLERAREIHNDNLAIRSAMEMAALDRIASGDLDGGLAAMEEAADYWLESDVAKQASLLFAATAVTLPSDHPLRSDYARRAREIWAKFNIDPIPVRDLI